MEGDPDLQFLLKGGDLLKVRSSSWKKTRFFKLQEDCKTMWHESKKLFKTNQTCECCPRVGSPIFFFFSRFGAHLTTLLVEAPSDKTIDPVVVVFISMCFGVQTLPMHICTMTVLKTKYKLCLESGSTSLFCATQLP